MPARLPGGHAHRLTEQRQSTDAPERVARPRRRRVAAQGRRADQGRPCDRERRARAAEHVRRARTTASSTASRSRSNVSPTCCCTSRAGVVTTASDPQGRQTVVDLVDHPARVVPVGRLDADTTGVLLLTNDGELAHRLAHPRYEIDKVYEVERRRRADRRRAARARARASSSTTGRRRPPPSAASTARASS